MSMNTRSSCGAFIRAVEPKNLFTWAARSENGSQGQSGEQYTVFRFPPYCIKHGNVQSSASSEFDIRTRIANARILNVETLAALLIPHPLDPD